MSAKTLSNFVFIAGIYNFLLAMGLTIPFVTELLKMNICDYALSLLIAALLIFTAVVQVFASRDLQKFGWLIYWEGILRWMAAAILITYGFFGHLGIVTGILGLGDFVIGFVFLVLLPNTISKSHGDLLRGI